MTPAGMETPVEIAEECIEKLTLINEAQKKHMLAAFTKRIKLFNNSIHFYPHPFTPLSLTGGNCELSCKHCNKHYLHHMLDASCNLQQIAEQLHNKGAKGIILSGGSTTEGFVPIYQHREEIHRIKNKLPLHISAHTGIITREQAKQLHFLNTALIDVLADNETIHDILGINKTTEDIENTLRYLSEEGIPIAPHIIVGIHGGKLKGELRALEMVKKYRPQTVVIVVFIPTKNTPLEHTSPPVISDVVKIITTARIMLDASLSLSCVRPGGRYRSQLDHCAILSGVDRIAVPTQQAYKTAKTLKLHITEHANLCCPC
jgi:hypothetical protein